MTRQKEDTRLSRRTHYLIEAIRLRSLQAKARVSQVFVRKAAAQKIQLPPLLYQLAGDRCELLAVFDHMASRLKTRIMHRHDVWAVQHELEAVPNGRDRPVPTNR